MKASGILLIILISVGVRFAGAQTLDETYTYAEALQSSGNYDLAVKNYKRVLFFDSAYQYPLTSRRLADCYYALENYADALYYYRHAFNEAGNDSLRAEATIMKAASNIKLGDYSSALIDIYSFEANTSSKHKYNLLMLEGIVNFNLAKYAESELNFLDASAMAGLSAEDRIRDFFVAVKKIESRYNPRVARTMSIIIPGSGQMYAGNFRSGLNSFVLTAGLFTLGVVMTQSLSIMDSFFIVVPWFQRYYMGGFKNAFNQTLDKQNEKKQEVLKNIVFQLKKAN